MRKLGIISVLLSILTAGLFADDKVNIKADKLDYDESTKNIFARGNVEISSGNFKMSGKKMDINLDRQFALAEGSVSIKDGDSLILGSKCEYNYSQSTGNIYDAYGYYYPWGFKGDKIFKSNQDLYLGKSDFTTCNAKVPHYHLRVKSASLKPNKEMVAKNVVLKIRNIPVFYYPAYAYSMSERVNSLEIYPGYNTYDGIQIKTVYGFPVSKYTYSKLCVDLFQNQGIGTGLEYNYNNPDKVKGSTYLYHIKEDKNMRERYTVRSSHWEKLSKTWSLQGNLNYQSDEYFNQFYFGENWNRLTSDFRSDIALTKQTSLTNFQISSNRRDVFDPAAKSFVLDEYDAPKMDFTVFQFKPKYSPLYAGFSTNLYRNYSSKAGTVTWNSSSDFYLTRQFPVSLRTTITPKIGAIETWRLLLDTQTFITNYYSALSLRQRINWFTYMEFTHNYKNRSIINSQEIDTFANDYGIEGNNIAAMLYVSQISSRYLRMSTSYDFREFKTPGYTNNLARYSPLITEIGTLLSRKVSIYLNHQFNIESSSTTSYQTEVTFTPSARASYSMGLYYVQTSTNGVQLNNQFSFWIGNKWFINLTLIGMVNNSQYTIKDEGLKIYRDLHCWETSVTYNKRGEVEEYFFNIGLKIASRARQGLYDEKLENEFYPWR
ncbi:MAG: LPS export ABC transporter periplasmic protein LptC [Elusimicrobia bacterium]|nr:LPS export ABC transporter periplasmic protein LptC [Elusimicrobiota bacterium]